VHYSKPAVFFLVLLLVTSSHAVTFVSDFDVDETASGIAHDGESIWMGHLGDDGDAISRIADDDGTVLGTIDSPARGCYGIDWFANMLWYVNDSPESAIYGITPAGRVVQEWDLPGEFMTGITAGDGDLWVGSYHQPTGYLYRLDTVSGDSLGILMVPGTQPRALAWQNGNIWVADEDDGYVRMLNPDNAAVLDSFEAPYGSPKGLAYDGRWLWLLDEGPDDDADRIYRIDSRPAVPVASVEPLELDYGAVTVDYDSTIEVTILNSGRAPLNVIQVRFAGNPTGFEIDVPTLPAWLQEYQSLTFSLNFDPPGIGNFSQPYVYMTTNDPNFSYHEFDIFAIGGYSSQTFNTITREDPLNFGTIRMQHELDAMQVKYFVFSNLGSPILVIESFESTTEDFFISEDLPKHISGGRVDSLAIWWRPLLSGLAEESFTITTNDEIHPSITVGLRGNAAEEYPPGGTVLWEHENGDEILEGFSFVGEISDIAGIGHTAIVGITLDGNVIAYNSNANDNAQILYQAKVTLPGAEEPGLNDDTGYLTRNEMATTIEDIDDDGYIDLVYGSDGDRSGTSGLGVVVAVSGYDGSMIWTLDSEALGGSPVTDVRAVPDLDDDDLPDVMIVFGTNEDGGGPQRVQIHNGATGFPIWISSQQGDFYTAILGPDTNGDGIREIIAGTSDNMLYAIDGTTGYPIWGNNIGGGVYKILNIQDVGGSDIDDIVVSFTNGLVAIDPENGEEIWAAEDVGNGSQAVNLGNFIDIEDELVVIGQSNGAIVGVLTDNGETYYTRNVGNSALDIKKIHDLNGDGIPEFAVGTAGNRISIFEGDGSDVLWSYTEGGDGRYVQSICQVEDVEWNYSVEIACCTRNGIVRFFTGGTEATGVSENTGINILPNNYSIKSAYPNPFNSSVRLEFNLPTHSLIPLGIYNSLGQLVDIMTIAPGGGSAVAVWQPSSQLSSGMYFIRMDNKAKVSTRVMYVK